MFETGFVESYDKTKIYYSFKNNKSSKTLVFSYGVTCGMYHFKYQDAYFKKSYSILQYDYRGHNNSGLPSNLENLSIEGCAYDLKAVLDKLGIKKTVLIGHSMGVAVNLKFYELFPEYVEAMVFICGGITNPFDIMFYTDTTKVIFEFLKMAYLKFPGESEKVWKNIPTSLSHAFISLVGYNKMLAQKNDILIYVEAIKSHSLEMILHVLQDYSKFNGEEICKKITCPTLILGGQYDLVTPLKHIHHVHKLVKTSELFVVPQGSHVSQWDMPEVINLRIEKFLKAL